MRKKIAVGDRVDHYYLGKGTVQKIHNSQLDPKVATAYTIETDETPDVRYNMGNRCCLAFPSDISRSNDDE